jgi:hypothetical protein
MTGGAHVLSREKSLRRYQKLSARFSVLRIFLLTIADMRFKVSRKRRCDLLI